MGSNMKWDTKTKVNHVGGTLRYSKKKINIEWIGILSNKGWNLW